MPKAESGSTGRASFPALALRARARAHRRRRSGSAGRARDRSRRTGSPASSARGGGGTERVVLASVSGPGTPRRAAARLPSVWQHAMERDAARRLRISTFAYETVAGARSTVGVSATAWHPRGGDAGPLRAPRGDRAHVARGRPRRTWPGARPRRFPGCGPRCASARGCRASAACSTLDLAVVGQAWTAFRGRVARAADRPARAPRSDVPSGAVLPARGTLGVEATATFSRRATVFLQLDHALGQQVGAAVVQGEPLPVRVAPLRRVLGAAGLTARS